MITESEQKRPWNTLSAFTVNQHTPECYQFTVIVFKLGINCLKSKPCGAEEAGFKSPLSFLFISINLLLVNNKWRTINLNKVPATGSHKARAKQIKSSLWTYGGMLYMEGRTCRKGRFIRTVAGSNFYFTASPFDEALNDPRSNFLFETGQMNSKKYTIITTIKIIKNHI